MTQPDQTDPPSGHSPCYRVLVIDDNASIHEDFQKILGGASAAQVTLRSMESVLFGVARPGRSNVSFEINGALQGEEGLERIRRAKAEQRPYSLVFVDGRMPPGWDGIETITQLWREQPDLQIVLCTAYSDYTWDQIRQVVGESDNILILKKPFDNVEVLQLAHALTKKWHLSRLVQERIADLDRLVSERTAEVRRAMALFEASLAQSPVGILIADAPDLHLRWINAVAQTLLSTGTPMLHGEVHYPVSGLAFFLPDGAPCPEDSLPLVRAIHHGEITRNLELILHHASGEDRCVMVSAAPIRDPHGHVNAGIAILQDITEQKKASLEKEALRAQMVQAQKMESVGRLAGGVAHDFNNMLQAILGNVEVALTDLGPNNPSRDELLEIRNAAERSAELTRQLLAFARRQPIHPTVLDLNDVISGMIRMLQSLIGENIHLSWMPASNLWTVKIDPSQIDQLLANLAVNARDAIEGTGRVAIRTCNVTLDAEGARHHTGATAGDYVVVSISDSGRGMDEETCRHVFEPFFTTKDVGKGTGLGLASVFGIVHQNRGFIELETKPGEGTTFRIHIPRSDPPAIDAGEPGAAQTIRGTETVLLVEDEPQVLTFGKRVLSQQGYKVLTAATPETALALMDHTPGHIDLLITDVIMPRMNGKQLYEQLRARQPDLRCLFVSGYTADVIARQGVLEGGVHFLQKPFTIQMLAARVREALEHRPT